MNKFFVVTASVLVALLLIFDQAGLGAHTSVLSGMATDASSAFGGLVYVLAWFAAVIVAPILFLAAIVLRLLR